MCFGGGAAGPVNAARAAAGVTPTLDPDLLQAFKSAARAAGGALVGEPPTLDPDLQQAFKSANRRTSTKGQAIPLSPVQMQRQREILAEQQRRDQLRTAYTKAEQAANDQLKQIAEQQQQAQAARAAEGERQAQLQRDVAQARVAQEQQLAQEQLATQAATASMQVLRGQSAAAQGPAAQQTRGQGGRRNPRQTTVQSLRIGTSANGPGVGLNIGG